MRRAVGVGALAAVWLLVLAGPAAADPPGPTNYRSVVQTVETPGGEPVDLDVEVLGGDAFLVVRVPEGRRVEVPGYDGEPYVRVTEDGGVEVNHRAPTHWFNADRYGAQVPGAADAEAAPVWRTVAESGAYAWHDHRIHWMSPSVPDQVDTGRREAQEVLDWEIGLRLDGEPVVVEGSLTWHPGPPAWVPGAWIVAALAVAALLVVRLAVPVAGLAVAGGLLAGAASAATVVGQPAGAEGDVTQVVLPGLALVAGALALWLRARDPDGPRPRLLGAAATVPLLVWGILQAGALTRPVVPEPLTAGVLRPVVAVAVGLGVVGLVEGGRRVLAALPDTLADGADDGTAGEGGG